MAETITCQRLSDSTSDNKKAIKTFYKRERYSAKFKGFDLAYAAYLSPAASKLNHLGNEVSDIVSINAQREHTLVAAVIISQLHQTNTQALLHGLVTNSELRGKGIASRLLSFAIGDIKKRESSQSAAGIDSIVCFSDPSLRNFYLSHRFTQINADDQGMLTPSIKARLLAYQKHQPNLSVFYLSLR